jgi:hypothetical protein
MDINKIQNYCMEGITKKKKKKLERMNLNPPTLSGGNYFSHIN